MQAKDKWIYKTRNSRALWHLLISLKLCSPTLQGQGPSIRIHWSSIRRTDRPGYPGPKPGRAPWALFTGTEPLNCLRPKSLGSRRNDRSAGSLRWAGCSAQSGPSSEYKIAQSGVRINRYFDHSNRAARSGEPVPDSDNPDRPSQPRIPPPLLILTPTHRVGIRRRQGEETGGSHGWPAGSLCGFRDHWSGRIQGGLASARGQGKIDRIKESPRDGNRIFPTRHPSGGADGAAPSKTLVRFARNFRQSICLRTIGYGSREGTKTRRRSLIRTRCQDWSGLGKQACRSADNRLTKTIPAQLLSRLQSPSPPHFQRQFFPGINRPVRLRVFVPSCEPIWNFSPKGQPWPN